MVVLRLGGVMRLGGLRLTFNNFPGLHHPKVYANKKEH